MHDAGETELIYDPERGYRTADYEAIEANNVIRLKSVGIDVGSSTSHLIFSGLMLVRQGAALSSRFRVVKRETIHKSNILLTPYTNPATIDTKALSDFIANTYDSAGLSAQEVDTGAVIVTGEAAKKENAEAIAKIFSDQAGKFVCATAGPNLEAVMAAFGSGAVHFSSEDHRGGTVLNVDIGGGTSKLAIVKDATIVETAAINVGARLIAVDEQGHITRIEDAGRLVAREAGVDVSLGGEIPPGKDDEIAGVLADCLFEVVERKPLSPLAEKLMITEPLGYEAKIDCIMFSGGVSEYVYGRDARDYGDFGAVLGREIRQRATSPDLGMRIVESEQQIRATVIGASQYTVQVSGSTIFVSDRAVLPLRNLQVLAPVLEETERTPEGLAASIRRAFARFDTVDGERPVALAIHWSGDPSYRRAKALADGVVLGLKQTIANGLPVVLVFDSDIGGMVGNILARELIPGHPCVSIDEIDLAEFDFIDIGEPLEDFQVVPVVIKSLVFAPTRHDGSVLVSTKG